MGADLVVSSDDPALVVFVFDKIGTQGYTQRPKCLDLSEDLLSWNGARRQFQRMGGDLVVPFDVAAIGAYAGVQAGSSALGCVMTKYLNVSYL